MNKKQCNANSEYYTNLQLNVKLQKYTLWI